MALIFALQKSGSELIFGQVSSSAVSTVNVTVAATEDFSDTVSISVGITDKPTVMVSVAAVEEFVDTASIAVGITDKPTVSISLSAVEDFSDTASIEVSLEALPTVAVTLDAIEDFEDTASIRVRVFEVGDIAGAKPIVVLPSSYDTREPQQVSLLVLDPGEIKVLEFDFSDLLLEGETLSDVVVSSSYVSGYLDEDAGMFAYGLAQLMPQAAPKTALQRVLNGKDETIYKLKALGTTSAGNVHAIVCIIKIVRL